MEKIWLKSYPPGVPAEINPDAYESLVEVLESSFRAYGKRKAFYNLGVSLTYDDIDHLSRQFASYLQNVLKLQKGDRIAIMLPNILQYPVAIFGALRAGLVVVNVNPLYTPNELVHQVNNAGATCIIALSNFSDTLQKALPEMPDIKHVIITQMGDLFPPFKAWLTDFFLKYISKKNPTIHLPNVINFKTCLEEGKKYPLKTLSIRSDDIAFLQYTGGTTGISKGAILTHRNIIANLQQADAWFSSLLSHGQEIIITALPLYHIFSLTANCLFFTKIGGLNVLITNPRDVSAMIKEMRKFKFTALTGVNTLFNALTNSPSFANLDFTELRLALGGGMAVQRIVAEKWQKITGAPLLEAYGLTETSPCVSINPANLKSYNGTIGLPVSSTDVCILDADGNEVPRGEPGELAIKGPQVMRGYWNNPEETAKVFTKDGWLLTGDIATMDQEGFLRILERKKDMILVSGFNVYPNEIENVLVRMPGVHEVAVIGTPDEHSGEHVKAYIVKNRDVQNLTEADVIQYARERLTAYKIPREVEFCTELPKSNVGKILKRVLRDHEEQIHH